MNIQTVKHYLLAVLSMGNWTAALTAALLTVYPLTLGKATVGQIVIGFLVTFLLVATGGYLSHVKDVALKNALTSELQAIAQKIPMPGTWSATNAKQPQPLTLPTVPKSDTTSQ